MTSVRNSAVVADSGRSAVPPPSCAARPRVLYALTDSASLLFLSGQLAYLRENGFEVAILTTPSAALREFARQEGVQHIGVPMQREISPVNDLVALVRLWKVLRNHTPIITNVGTPKAGLLVGLAALLAGVPCRVYTLHGLRMETAEGFKRLILLLAEKLACRCAHVVICVSPSLRKKVVEIGLVAAERAIVLGSGSCNGVDVAQFEPTPQRLAKAGELRNQLGIPAGAPVVGFLGRLTRDKGVPELVEAFERLQVSVPESRLLLLGDYESGDPVPADVRRRLQSNPRVIHMGFVPDPTPYYQLMDVVVLPSHREGFPLVPLEAQAAGKPVVTTFATGAVDSVVDGHTGILVPIGDPAELACALQRILQNQSARAAMAANGHARMLREFRPEMIWKELAGQYQRLLREVGFFGGRTSEPDRISTAQ